MSHGDLFSGNNGQVNALQVENLPEKAGSHRPGVMPDPARAADGTRANLTSVTLPPEIGGRDGPEPTRFGDWEKSGRCIDF